MEYDGVNLHNLVEYAYRIILVWGTGRFCRCGHCEGKHQDTKRVWGNTNHKDKPKQVMIAINRVAALLHVLLGGFWHVMHKGQKICVQAGPKVLEQLNKPDSFASDVLRQLTKTVVLDREPLDVKLFVSSFIFVHVPFICIYIITLYICTQEQGEWTPLKGGIVKGAEVSEEDKKLVQVIIDQELKAYSDKDGYSFSAVHYLTRAIHNT